MFSLLLDGKLYIAPIPNPKVREEADSAALGVSNSLEKRVLDLGTGTGLWAM